MVVEEVATHSHRFELLPLVVLVVLGLEVVVVQVQDQASLEVVDLRPGCLQRTLVGQLLEVGSHLPKFHLGLGVTHLEADSAEGCLKRNVAA